MATQKFDSNDRRHVITQLEKKLGVNLEQIGSYQKYMRDIEGKRYCILGGYGNWHGIPREIVEREEREGQESVLVVAKRYDQHIDIFLGPLQPLVQNKLSLAYTRQGQFEFNTEISGSRMKIRKVPGLILRKLSAVNVNESEV